MTQAAMKLWPKVILAGTLTTHCANDSDDPTSRRSTSQESAAQSDNEAVSETVSPFTEAEQNDLGLLSSEDAQPDNYIVTVPTKPMSSSERKGGVTLVGDAKMLNSTTSNYAMKSELFGNPNGTPLTRSGSTSGGTEGQVLKLQADFDQLPVLSVSVAGGMNSATRTSLEQRGYIISPVVNMKPVGMADLKSIGFQIVPSFKDLVAKILKSFPLPLPQLPEEYLPKVAILDLAIDSQTLPMRGRSLKQIDCTYSDPVSKILTCAEGVASAGTSHGTDVTSVVQDMLPLEVGILAFNIFPTQKASMDEPATDSSYALKALNLVLCMKNRWNKNERGNQGAPGNPLCKPRNILAVNLSFATSASFLIAPCNTPQESGGLGGPGGVIEQLRTAGVSVVAAAGNSKTKIGLPVPACISGAFSVGVKSGSVGSSYPYSMASYLKILAPGENVSVAGGASRMGSSFAAPFVTGALAIQGTANPSWTPQQREDRLIGLGKKNSVTIERNLSSGKSVIVTVPTLFLGGKFWQ